MIITYNYLITVITDSDDLDDSNDLDDLEQYIQYMYIYIYNTCIVKTRDISYLSYQIN